MITINLNKAKEIGHAKRRLAREIEFAPYDAVISKQIPGADAQLAEAARQAIREKYAEIQTSIDSAETVDQIKTALGI